jgi:two-component system, NarL family, response regulator LiaR
MCIRVLVADDHEVVRQGLRMFLHVDGEFEVIGEAGNGAEALRLARELKPDVVLMDILMPVMDGITATALIRKELPEVEVLALTSVTVDASIVEVMRAGAISYILKETTGEDLRKAIRAAASGQVLLSPGVAASLIGEIKEPAPSDALTKREMEVLGLMANGESNREIASRLFLSEQTVKSHVSRILGKLGVASRTQAAVYAMRHGLSAGTDDAAARKP